MNLTETQSDMGGRQTQTYSYTDRPTDTHTGTTHMQHSIKGSPEHGFESFYVRMVAEGP